MRCPCSPQAFTLVEMLLVILVLGIAATLALPHMGQASQSRLPAAMRMLEADMGFAQAYSIAHHDDPCIVVFDDVKESYHLAKKSTPELPLTHPGDKQPYRVTWGQGRASSLPGIAFKTLAVGDDKRLEFGGLGQLDQSTTAIITLTDGQADMSLRLDPITGLPRITQP